MFLFLTYYLQLTKGLSPIETGLAYLPMTAAIIVSATLATNNFLPKIGPRPLLVIGMTLGALAMVWFAQLDTTSSYAGHVLPGLDRARDRDGQHLRAGDLQRDLRRRSHGRRRRLRDGEHDAAGRRLDRHGVAELDLRQRGQLVSRRAGRASPQVAVDAAMHGYTVAFWVAAGVFAFGAIVVGSLMHSIKIEADAPVEATGEPQLSPS